MKNLNMNKREKIREKSFLSRKEKKNERERKNFMPISRYSRNSVTNNIVTE